VDIGCNHPFIYSNSYLFERNFGCKTIAIDPLVKYEALWLKARSEAIFVPCAIGDAKGKAEFIIAGEEEGDPVDNHADMFSSLQGFGKHNDLLKGQKIELVEVKTLSMVLDEQGVDDILYCSIDTEGNELSVLRGIDFTRHNISIFTIENNHESALGSNEVRRFLKNKGYYFYARIWGLDDIYVKRELFSVAGL
jgi:FkbM family methyltransferase